MVARGKEGEKGQLESLRWTCTHTAVCKMDSHKDLPYSTRNCSVLCGSLDGRGVWGRKDTWIYMAESFCSPPKTITTVLISYQFSSVQSLSRVRLFATPWITARQAALSITISQSSPQTHVHWVHDAIQPSHPLSSPSPPAPNPSQHQGLFQWVNSSHEVAKVLEFPL